jgi:hypothetical protein
VHVLSPTPHPPIVPVISTAVGRRFFPPSLPRSCRRTQWRNLSSTDRVGPQFPYLDSNVSVTKATQIRTLGPTQHRRFLIPSKLLVGSGICRKATRVSPFGRTLEMAEESRQRVLPGSVAKSALAPFQTICTPMHTSKNDVSCRITVMPVVPSTRPRRSAKL